VLFFHSCHLFHHFFVSIISLAPFLTQLKDCFLGPTGDAHHRTLFNQTKGDKHIMAKK
jgi:hypothetical protein